MAQKQHILPTEQNESRLHEALDSLKTLDPKRYNQIAGDLEAASLVEALKESEKTEEKALIHEVQNKVDAVKAELRTIIASKGDKVPPELQKAYDEIAAIGNISSKSEASAVSDKVTAAQKVEQAESGEQIMQAAGTLMLGAAGVAAGAASMFAHLVPDDLKNQIMGWSQQVAGNVMDNVNTLLPSLGMGAGTGIKK